MSYTILWDDVRKLRNRKKELNIKLNVDEIA